MPAKLPPPVILRDGEGEHVWGAKACITVKLRADAVEGRRMSVIEVLAPADFGPPLHIHNEEDELVYVIEGTVRIACGDADSIVDAGGSAFLPRGVPHAFWVVEGPARLFVVFTPGGVEAMFADHGVPTDAARLPEPGTVVPGAMEPYERRHNVEMIGPPLGPPP